MPSAKSLRRHRFLRRHPLQLRSCVKVADRREHPTVPPTFLRPAANHRPMNLLEVSWRVSATVLVNRVPLAWGNGSGWLPDDGMDLPRVSVSKPSPRNILERMGAGAIDSPRPMLRPPPTLQWSASMYRP